MTANVKVATSQSRESMWTITGCDAILESCVWRPFQTRKGVSLTSHNLIDSLGLLCQACKPQTGSIIDLGCTVLSQVSKHL